jgi:hypothetical protein
MRTMNVGAPKARQIREHLAQLMEEAQPTAA